MGRRSPDGGDGDHCGGAGPSAVSGSGGGLATAAGPPVPTAAAAVARRGPVAAAGAGAGLATVAGPGAAPAARPAAITSLAGAQVWLTTGAFTVPSGPADGADATEAVYLV
jgi:hypothetical protein